MKILISFFVGIIIFSGLGWLTTLPIGVPYNVSELFTDYNLLTLFIFSCLLYWCFGIPVCLSLWMTRDKWTRIMIFPFMVVFQGAVAYVLLRISVPLESIMDIVGFPILNWAWEWELLGRFIALFGLFSLFLTGGSLVALLQSYICIYKGKLIYRWLVNVVVLLPIIWWIVVRQAATDNLTELMRGGGNWISILSLSIWIFIIASVSSILIVQILRCRRYSLVSAVLIGLFSFPIGFFALQIGTEDVIYKYDMFFSAMQFLFSPNRSNLVGQTDLICRYTIFHLLTVSIIAFAQYPFWRLICLNEVKSSLMGKINQ